jgi:hypothetical protein
MLPRWHIILGAIFTALVWLAIPNIQIIYLILIFLSSFLIDFDHYLVAVRESKKLGIKNSLNVYKKKSIQEEKEIKKGIRKKGDFHLFHTVEFHIFIGLLSYFWIGFYYIFIGMVFHSLLDLFYLIFSGRLHRREYFLFNWAIKRSKQN